MSGKDLVEVGKLRQALQRVEEVFRAFACVNREIGACSVADEEGVAREHESLADDERAVLRAVTGRVDDADSERSEVEHVAVLQRIERKLGPGSRMDRHRNVVLQREPAVTGDVVGVRVRLEHARETEPMLLGRLEVGLDLVGGVDDERLALGRVADEV